MRREYKNSLPHLWSAWLSGSRRCLQQARDLLPSQCQVCRQWPGTRLCDDCCAHWAAATARCRHCARSMPEGLAVCGSCLRSPCRLRYCGAAVDYAYPWREVLARFKFQGDIGLARSLAQLLLQAPGSAQALAHADWLLPVPIAAARLRERGFHQTLLLAQALAPDKTLGQALLRRPGAGVQHLRSRAQRLTRLRGAFAVAPAQAWQLRQRHLLLVDDVMTTGATLDAAADCLLRAGAASVSALVLARTPAP